MSKQRMIRDSFWTDAYIEKLTPDEKLLFLYLLTNPLCNVLGIYEVRSKRIGFETGYDIEVVDTILGRFEADKKILRHDDWIVMVNHTKNQSMNPSIIQGCQRIFDELQDEMKVRVTGWVQAGLLNLTLLNLTLPNLTPPKKSGAVALPRAETKPKESKLSHGEFSHVQLTEKEHDKLVGSINESGVEQLITELDTYIESTGKKYKSHYATIQAWARRRITDHIQKTNDAKTKII